MFLWAGDNPGVITWVLYKRYLMKSEHRPNMPKLIGDKTSLIRVSVRGRSGKRKSSRIHEGRKSVQEIKCLQTVVREWRSKIQGMSSQVCLLSPPDEKVPMVRSAYSSRRSNFHQNY